MLVFEESGIRSTRRKPLGAEKRTNKLNPHMTTDLGIEPGPHWLEAVLSPLCQPGTPEVYSKVILSLWRWWPIPFWTLSSPSFSQILTSYLSLPRNSCWYIYFTFQATQSGNMSLVINYKYQKTWHGCEYHIIDAYVYADHFYFCTSRVRLFLLKILLLWLALGLAVSTGKSN